MNEVRSHISGTSKNYEVWSTTDMPTLWPDTTPRESTAITPQSDRACPSSYQRSSLLSTCSQDTVSTVSPAESIDGCAFQEKADEAVIVILLLSAAFASSSVCKHFVRIELTNIKCWSIDCLICRFIFCIMERSIDQSTAEWSLDWLIDRLMQFSIGCWLIDWLNCFSFSFLCLLFIFQLFYVERRKRFIPVLYDEFPMPGWMTTLIGNKDVEVGWTRPLVLTVSCSFHFFLPWTRKLTQTMISDSQNVNATDFLDKLRLKLNRAVHMDSHAECTDEDLSEANIARGVIFHIFSK